MLPSLVTVVTFLIMWVTGSVWLALLFPLAIFAVVGLFFLLDWLEPGRAAEWVNRRLFPRGDFPPLYSSFKPPRR